MSVAIAKFLSWNLYEGPEIHQEKSLGGQLHSTNNCYNLFQNISSSTDLFKNFQY